MQTSFCTRCKLVKPQSEFKYNRRKRNGCSSWCKTCGRIFVHLRRYRKAGVDETVYNQMKLKQNNVCAICKKPEMAKRGTLAIDHDKITGKIRGLLCFKCNFGIGYLQHDTELLAAAIKYLKDAEN